MYYKDDPDLGDERLGMASWQEDYYKDSTYDEPYYRYQFTDLESLVRSDVFQQQLALSLQFKDKQIRELQ